MTVLCGVTHTVFGSKQSAICAQAVYFLHSTMPSVTCLLLSDVSFICHVNCFKFHIQDCFSSMSVSQAAQWCTWFTQYQTLPKGPLTVKFSKFCVESFHRDTDWRCCVQISWNLADGKSVKLCVIYWTKKNKILPACQNVTTVQIVLGGQWNRK